MCQIKVLLNQIANIRPPPIPTPIMGRLIMGRLIVGRLIVNLGTRTTTRTVTSNDRMGPISTPSTTDGEARGHAVNALPPSEPLPARNVPVMDPVARTRGDVVSVLRTWLEQSNTERSPVTPEPRYRRTGHGA